VQHGVSFAYIEVDLPLMRARESTLEAAAQALGGIRAARRPIPWEERPAWEPRPEAIPSKQTLSRALQSSTANGGPNCEDARDMSVLKL
jgi:hypothetical protein